MKREKALNWPGEIKGRFKSQPRWIDSAGGRERESERGTKQLLVNALFSCCHLSPTGALIFDRERDDFYSHIGTLDR